ILNNAAYECEIYFLLSFSELKKEIYVLCKFFYSFINYRETFLIFLFSAFYDKRSQFLNFEILMKNFVQDVKFCNVKLFVGLCGENCVLSSFLKVIFIYYQL